MLIIELDRVPGKLESIINHFAPKKVEMVIFKGFLPPTEEGDNIYGAWHKLSGTVFVNVNAHEEYAAAEMMRDSNDLSYRTLLWYSLLNTLAHEFCHAEQTNPDSEEAEKEADNVAGMAPWKWAKEFDLELPLDWGGLTGEVRGIEESFDPKSEHPWEITQLACLTKGFTWYDRDLGTFKGTYRSCAKSIIQDGDPKWDEVAPPRGEEIIEPPKREAVAQTAQAATTQTPTPQQMAAAFSDGFGMGKANMSAAQEQAVPDFANAPPVDQDEEVMVSDYTMDQEPDMPSMSSYAAPLQAPSVQTPPRQPAPPVPQAPPTPGTKKAAFAEFITRLHNHIYEKCGFNPAAQLPFSYAGMVTEPVYIGDIPGLRDMLIGYDCVDEHGRALYFNSAARDEIAARLSRGIISGTVTTKQAFPVYNIYVNKGGSLLKLSVLPQNPNKLKDDGSLSPWAIAARNGAKKTVVLLPNNQGISSFVSQEVGAPPVWQAFKGAGK